MISIYYRTIKDERLQRLSKVRVGAWIDVVDPDKEEIRYLERMGISSAQIEDGLDPDELPRIEIEGENVYVILNVPYEENGEILTTPLLIVITPDIFVTLSRKHLECIDVLLRDREIYTTQKTKNLLQFCLEITETYEKEIRKINKNIYTKRVNLSKLTNKDIVALVELEEVLNKFVTSLVSLIGIFEKILSGKYVEIFEKDQELTEDLINDSRQSLDMCRTSIKNIANIRQAYSTVLTNDLNKIIKFLTSLTIIIGISTLIASLYGMNVILPGQSNPLAFVYIFLFTVLTSLILVLVFYFKKWL
jgi:magnesium transporter